MSTERSVYGIIAVIVAGMLGLAWLHNPPPSSHEQPPEQTAQRAGAQTESEKQKADPQRTAPSIQSTPTGDLKAKHTDNPASSNPDPDKGKKDWWDLLNVAFTGAVALFTLALVAVGSWQAMHLRRTVQSFISGERPYLYPEPGPFPDLRAIYQGKDLATIVSSPSATCQFANVGRTSAVIKEVRFGLHIGEALPAKPDFGDAPIRRAEIIHRPTTSTDSMQVGLTKQMTIQQTWDMLDGATHFFIFGYVKYTDVFNRLHTKGFGLRYRPKSKDYEVAGDAAYNYSMSQSLPKNLAGA